MYTDQGCTCSNSVTPSPPSLMPIISVSPLPPARAQFPSPGSPPLQDQEAHQCHDIFLYHPGMPGQWGYFGCQVRDVARAPMGIFRMPGPRCGQSHGEEAAVDAWVATPYLY